MSASSVNYRDMITEPNSSFGPATHADASPDYPSGVRLETSTVAEWDDTLTQFGDGIPEQTGIFNASRWGLRNISCVKIFRHLEQIGGAALIVRKVPFTSTGLAVLKWGPLWRRAGIAADLGLYEEVVKALVAEYCHRRNFHLTILPPAFPQISSSMCQSLKSLGFSRGNVPAAPERYIVNTGQTSEELMASLDQKWRYNLRKAMKNDFEIRFADNAQGLDIFLELYGKMMARKQFLDSSAIGALSDIMRTADIKVRPRIVLVSHEGEVTAGGIFSMYGDMASYMFGATDNRALRLKAGYALHWWVAEYLCNLASAKWYDLGGNDSDAGLHQFKKGFVGKSGHLMQAPPRYHFAASTLAATTGSAIFKLRDTRAGLTRGVHAAKACLPKVGTGFGKKDMRKQKPKALLRFRMIATCFRRRIGL